MKKLGLAILVVFLVLGVAMPAQAATRKERLFRWTNQVRANDVQVSDYLSVLARRQSKRMLRAGSLSHSDLACVCGEVVGVGIRYHLRDLFDAFMESRAHRQIILDGRYRRVGIAAIAQNLDGHRLVWVTMMFA